MNIFEYTTKDIESIYKELGSNSSNGLSLNEAKKRLLIYGANSIKISQLNARKIFIRQFQSAFIYLLLIAALITLVLGEMTDTIMIISFLCINTGLGFFQEYSSEKTAQLLQNFALPRAKVLRQGDIVQITADQLVPGDIIILNTGDKVPADIRIIEQNGLIIDETVLTGESIGVNKVDTNIKSIPNSYNEAINLAFSGTDILKGNAKAIVLATGKQTVFGNIAVLATESKKVSDFAKGINQFSRFILLLVAITLVIVTAAQIFIHGENLDILQHIIFAVALTVGVIPEGLPLVTTFSLSRGARRLAKKHVIVKRLSSIEDLGSIEILCSDKTGTLTENKLKVVNICSENNSETIWLANLASAFELKERIEPFDIAFYHSLNGEQKKHLKEVVKLHEEPFDPHTKHNSVIVKDGKEIYMIIRGAPEIILSHCKSLSQQDRDVITDWIASQGEQGHRSLAIAYKKISHYSEDTVYTQENMLLSGIISCVDPIKKSTLAAVEKAKKLGVKLIIITGDSPEVAGAVAHQIHLIDDSKKVITGSQWQRAHLARKNRYLDTYSVFSRISPEQKFEIISLLRERYMVGFLGEGINDAPALKVAGVSLVVNSAADIAREASDIILLKSNIGVIIDGIEEGRQVFANTTKYIKSTLISNFGNFFALATSSLLIKFLPMLPVQILLVNLLSDAPMVSISTDTADASELHNPQKYEVKDILILAIILGLVSTVFDFIFFGLFYRMGPSILQTNWFIGSILTELVLIFSIRSKSLFFKSTSPSKPLLLLTGIAALSTLIIPFTPFGHQVFQFVSPSKNHLILIGVIVLIYFILTEIIKVLYYKYEKLFKTFLNT